jgi:hypothetical protein
MILGGLRALSSLRRRPNSRFVALRRSALSSAELDSLHSPMRRLRFYRTFRYSQ